MTGPVPVSFIGWLLTRIASFAIWGGWLMAGSSQVKPVHDGGRESVCSAPGIKPVKVTRIFADERGESHFADAGIPLASATPFSQLPPFQFTRLSAPNGIKLFVVPAELSIFDLHTAPERQSRCLMIGRRLDGMMRSD